MCQDIVVMNLLRQSLGGDSAVSHFHHLNGNIVRLVLIALVEWGVTMQIKQS